MPPSGSRFQAAVPARRPRVGARVPVERLAGEHGAADSADPRGRAGEVALDERRLEPDRLEDLRAAVGGDRRDPHLRDRLQQALRDPLDRALLRLLDGQRFRQPALLDELGERLEHHVGVDGGGAVADQGREVVDVARLARLDHEPGLQARPLAHEVVVHRGDREQRRDRDAFGAEVPVGEDQDVHAAGERLVGLPADPLERRVEPAGALGDRPGDVERVRLEDGRVDLAQALELLVPQDRLRDHELVCVLGRLAEQVPLGADARRDAHHDRLARRVDRRVRHLREELLEVGVEERPLVGEDREGEVVAHRPDRLLRVAGERVQDHLQVLLRVAERELARAQRLDARHPRRARRQVAEVHDAPLEPLAVGPPARDLALHLRVLDDAAPLEVDQEELAGLEPALPEHVLGRLVEHAGLRGEDDPAVLRLEPAARAEAVAVERRADHRAVGEGDRGGPVPRLGQAAVEGVEALQRLGQVVAAVVGLGDHHHHRVRQRTACQHEQLEHVVEVRGVRAAGADDRQHLAQVVAEELGGELRLARAHPVDVAAHRVDLAVVGDHPVGVRELPAREGVGREARVDQHERALHPLVAQVGVAARELRRHQHPLVDDRPRREARDHELGAGGDLGDPADHVELALERVAVARELRRGSDDQLAHDRGGLAGGHADVLELHRHVAPPDDPLPLTLDRVDEDLLELGRSRGVVARQEEDGDAVGACGRQLRSDHGPEELVRQLQEHAGAVAGQRVGAGGAAMLEVLERRQGAAERLVRGDAVQPGHERDPAGVVLERGVVQPDRGGRPASCLPGVVGWRGAVRHFEKAFRR